MQAILSQFVTNKASTCSDGNDEDDAVFSGWQVVDNDDKVEPDMDNDDGDEIDSAVEASDNAMVDQVVRDLGDEEEFEEKLSREDINLGCFSISKVCFSDRFSSLI
jgi:hypothetical protein